MATPGRPRKYIFKQQDPATPTQLRIRKQSYGWREAHPEEYREYQRQYQRNYREQNKDKLNQYSKDMYKENNQSLEYKEQRRKYNRGYYIKKIHNMQPEKCLSTNNLTDNDLLEKWNNLSLQELIEQTNLTTDYLLSIINNPIAIQDVYKYWTSIQTNTPH